MIGIDPGLLFLFQFFSVKDYLGDVAVDLLPIRMEDLPADLESFDTTFSMGVLYHRRSPLDHLLELKERFAGVASWCWKHLWWRALKGSA